MYLAGRVECYSHPFLVRLWNSGGESFCNLILLFSVGLNRLSSDVVDRLGFGMARATRSLTKKSKTAPVKNPVTQSDFLLTTKTARRLYEVASQEPI